jgi:hypothetical protein
MSEQSKAESKQKKEESSGDSGKTKEKVRSRQAEPPVSFVSQVRKVQEKRGRRK